MVNSANPAKAVHFQALGKNSRNRANELLKAKFPSMTRHLHNTERAATGVRTTLRPKGLQRRSGKAAKAGWSPERRALQSKRIREWQPWRRSTGPKTEAGKARSAANAVKHGLRTQDQIYARRRVRHVLRVATENLVKIKEFLRAPACPPIKRKLRPSVRASRLRDIPFPALRQGRNVRPTHRACAFGEDRRWP